MQIAVLLMLSHFFFWPSALDWQMHQQNVVVRGTVVDDATGRPVPGASVFATSPALNARTVSDSNGNFIFLTLFPGTYSLAASKNGAETGFYAAPGYEPPALFAGFEYGATIVLSR
jgi:hypothetical protein